MTRAKTATGYALRSNAMKKAAVDMAVSKGRKLGPGNTTICSGAPVTASVPMVSIFLDLTKPRYPLPAASVAAIRLIGRLSALAVTSGCDAKA